MRIACLGGGPAGLHFAVNDAERAEARSDIPGAGGAIHSGWERIDAPLPCEIWGLISASSIPCSPENDRPREITRDKMDKVKAKFVTSTEVADRDAEMAQA